MVKIRDALRKKATVEELEAKIGKIGVTIAPKSSNIRIRRTTKSSKFRNNNLSNNSYICI